MSDTTERQGRCLCGAVRVTAMHDGNSVGACHCDMCRRWCSGPFMEIDCGTAVTFEGEENITVFASSEWAERGFCNKCGTNLFYRIKQDGRHMMAAGLFDDADDLAFKMQVFIDEKPGYYTFAEDTKTMTGAEIFALYAPKD